MLNDKEVIPVALAGLGFGEAVHLPALLTNPEFELVSLWHPRRYRLDTALEKYQLNGYQTWSDLLQDPKIKAIIIATPPEPRFELALEALKAGKHLLLEKPVALNADEVAELHRLAMQNHLSVAVDFEYRAVPLFMQAKRLLDQDSIGKP